LDAHTNANTIVEKEMIKSFPGV